MSNWQTDACGSVWKWGLPPQKTILIWKLRINHWNWVLSFRNPCGFTTLQSFLSPVAGMSQHRGQGTLCPGSTTCSPAGRPPSRTPQFHGESLHGWAWKGRHLWKDSMKAIMIIISASYYGPKLSQPTCSKTMLQENPIHCVGFINASSFWNVWLAVYPHLIAPKSAWPRAFWSQILAIWKPPGRQLKAPSETIGKWPFVAKSWPGAFWSQILAIWKPPGRQLKAPSGTIGKRPFSAKSWPRAFWSQILAIWKASHSVDHLISTPKKTHSETNTPWSYPRKHPHVWIVAVSQKIPRISHRQPMGPMISPAEPRVAPRWVPGIARAMRINMRPGGAPLQKRSSCLAERRIGVKLLETNMNMFFYIYIYKK